MYKYIVLVYGVSFLAFLTILAPGLIHILIDSFYVVPQEDQRSTSQSMSPNKKNDKHNNNNNDNNNNDNNNGNVIKINVTLAVVVMMFLMLIGLIWALNDHLREVILDFVWLQLNRMFSSSSSV